MVPLANVVDPRTGNSVFFGDELQGRERLQQRHGALVRYSSGTTNLFEDKAEFYYRSECNLITRAANQHVLISN